jgi:hypothetical protein
MKKFLPIILMAALVTFATQSKATIRRVGYFGTATAIDYTDLQSAHDAATPGDTIYLYPGNWNATVSRKIVLMGYGYFLTGAGANTGLQSITGTFSLTVYLSAGCDNSVFDGLDNFTIYNYGNSGSIISGITIKHCNISNIIATNYNNGSDYTGSNWANWQILQSVITGRLQCTTLANGFGAITNLKISNCVFPGFSQGYGGINATSNTIQITNCVMNYSPDFMGANTIVKNCIIILGTPGNDQNTVYQNCIQDADYGTSANFIAGTNGNQAVSNSTTPFFVTPTTTTSTDGVWVLATGSPAKAAGIGGIDCGIFSGTNPYVLSGLPAVPTFYKLTATSSTTSTNPYTITFSVQSR